MGLPRFAVFVIALVLLGPGVAWGADQTVNLPYMQADKDGSQWVVHALGYLQQQGNMPVYSSTGVLMVNGSSPQSRNQRVAKIDGKTGELVLENLPANTMTVTRRYLFNKEDGYVRIIDVIKNPQNRDQQVAVALNANSNYGVQSGQVVADPKKRGQNVAWVGQTSANNRAMVEVFNGVNAKTPLNVEYQPGNSQVTANMSVSVPAGKEVALMHIHAVANGAADGQEFARKLKDSKVMKDIPAGVRRLIVNWNAGSSFYGDHEVLRGEMTDVVEMRTGDQFRGTVTDPAYRIATFYGAVEVPAEKVIGIVSVGAVRPRQLLFTVDGDVFGGTLERDKVALELSDGQTMEVPLAQVARVGYRRRAGEPDEPAFDKPFVLMRTGERIAVKLPDSPITVHTRFGPMKLRPDQLMALVFQNEEHAVHEVRMTDGTRLAALVDAVQFEARLASSDQAIKFPLSSAARLQFRPDAAEAADEPQAVLRLTNEEVLVGSLSGKLQLDTGFSMLALDAEGIRALSRVKESPTDVQVQLWDETSFRGQLQEPVVACVTKGGLEVKVPIALIEDYVQPAPKPSGAVVNKIREMVAELNADDWATRQRAQERLSNMGAVTIGVLREMRPNQPEEAQSRIDQILAAIEKKGK